MLCVNENHVEHFAWINKKLWAIVIQDVYKVLCGNVPHTEKKRVGGRDYE